MFIPHANPYSPANSGTNSTAVVWYAGSVWLTLKSGKTTREEQSPVSCRSNNRRTGAPAVTWITSGLYPPLTVTLTIWTPPSNSAR